MTGSDVIGEFAKRFEARLRLNPKFIIKRGSRYYMINKNLRRLIGKGRGWLYAGTYLGKIEKGAFHPSFPLLFMIAEKAGNKVVVDDKTAWLFVCGRDIFKEGVLEIKGSEEKGAYTLVFNRYGECLGFGRIVKDLDKLRSGLAVKNILDIGDFLRRERQLELNF
ncbi:MAG: hypothetical protein QXZ68_03000 [Candidatus Bathyarchaeia archaeon]